MSSNDGYARCYLIFLNSIPGLEPTPEIIKQHAEHLAQLDGEGKLVLAGPIPERAGGLIVLRVPSLDHAKAIAEKDPMIAGRFQRYEVGTWIMSKLLIGFHSGAATIKLGGIRSMVMNQVPCDMS